MSKPDKVINMPADDWSPDQVLRWVQSQVDKGVVERVLVVTEFNDDRNFAYDLIWSKSQRRDLWYMISIARRWLEDRYFDVTDDG